jgi:hypothetical protein
MRSAVGYWVFVVAVAAMTVFQVVLLVPKLVGGTGGAEVMLLVAGLTVCGIIALLVVWTAPNALRIAILRRLQVVPHLVADKVMGHRTTPAEAVRYVAVPAIWGASAVRDQSPRARWSALLVRA